MELMVGLWVGFGLRDEALERLLVAGTASAGKHLDFDFLELSCLCCILALPFLVYHLPFFNSKNLVLFHILISGHTGVAKFVA